MNPVPSFACIAEVPHSTRCLESSLYCSDAISIVRRESDEKCPQACRSRRANVPVLKDAMREACERRARIVLD
jgi:hypothetical protein